MFDQSVLESIVCLTLDEAKRRGADQAEVGVSGSDGLSVSVRLDEVETLEKDRSQSMGVTVYKQQAKGSATTTDLSEAAVRQAVAAACSIADFTQMDSCAGLADAELMATSFPDLDLYHPWELSTEQAVEQALICEAAARSADQRISNSEGASLSSHFGISVYGNTHDFLASHQVTRHSLSCSVIAEENGDMQRDYYYDVARNADKLETAESIGLQAAKRSVSRLQPRRLPTQTANVLYTPDMARSLLGHFVSAIRGGALYRKASFLMDKKGERLFPEFIRIFEQPHLLGALGSSAYDNEGVATHARDLVVDGVLQDYVLDSYSARKLGLQTTGNAGGVRNLSIQAGTANQQALIKQMDTGLLLTEMMGSGVNGITGGYSRGAAGFWVENGVIQYPVSEITVAGNLLDIFKKIVAVGNDVKANSNTLTGSILVEGLMIAGS